jgi:hypothetical protein
MKMQMGESNWLDTLSNTAGKYLEYRTASDIAKQKTELAKLQMQYSSPLYRANFPAIPGVPNPYQVRNDNTMLYLGIGAVALLAFFLMTGDKK